MQSSHSVAAASPAVPVKAKAEASGTPTPMLFAYFFFLVAGATLYRMVSETEDAFAATMTLAELLQCLAMVLLAAQVLCSGSVASISGRSIALEALSLVCRLSSTLFYNGYLPTDKSGNWFFQCVDLCALAVSMWLLYQIFVQKRATYMEGEDSFPVVLLTIVCFVLAAAFHADLNIRPVFDTLWLAGLNLGTVSVLPQLSLIRRSGGRVAALTGHNIAVMAIGRTLAGYFFWLAREDIDCHEWVKGINHAMIAILGASFLHVLLVASFAYVYVKALWSQGLHSKELYLECGVQNCELASIYKKQPCMEV